MAEWGEGSYRFAKITRPTELQQSCVRLIGGFLNLYPVTGEQKFSQFLLQHRLWLFVNGEVQLLEFYE